MAVNPGPEERRLLEREDGLTVLERSLGTVESSGAGQGVFVAGEAGVGKTALVRRFCEGLRATRVLWGGCDPLTTPPPLGPFVDITSELGGAAAEIVARGARPYEVARALLDDLATQPGAVMVLEDLHWADDGTIDALAYLARRVQQVPVLVLGTYRDDELEPAHPLRAMLGRLATAAGLQRLHLQPLSRGGVETLARQAGRDGEAVYATTRGNPFFVSELWPPPPARSRPACAMPSSRGRRRWSTGRGICSTWWPPSRPRPSCGCSSRPPSTGSRGWRAVWRPACSRPGGGRWAFATSWRA